jgi:hypothetical protein
MTHVISLKLILQSNEISLTNFFASLPKERRDVPNIEQTNIKPNKFKLRRLLAVLLKCLIVSFLEISGPISISMIVSYSLNETSTILSGNKFLLKIKVHF